MKKLKRSVVLLLLMTCCGFHSCDNQNDKYLSQKALNTYAKKAQLIQPNTSSNPPFDTLIYNKVIAYDFEGSDGTHESPIRTDTVAGFAPVILRQKSLNQKQADFLTNFLTDIETYGGLRYGCFYPRLGIAFYQNDDVQCVVNICMDCNFQRSSVTIPITQTKNDDDYISFGFSEQGRQNIIELSKQLGFEYGKL